MSSHRVWLETFPDQAGEHLVIAGEEAHHAVRVKRLVAGDPIDLIDGSGRIGRASIAEVRKTNKHGWAIECVIESVRAIAPVSPALEVWSAVPKGDRLEQMVDSLAQVGAASWSPMATERSVVEPREGKIGRLERVCHEACKQSGRPWIMGIGAGGSLAESLAVEEGTALVFADASGTPYRARGAGVIRLIVGPEGGWTPQEIEQARGAGATISSFGPHVMRIETAAVAGAAVIMGAELGRHA